MNKQEAIEKIEKEKSNLNAWEDLTRNRALDDALVIVRRLDEPEKPVVPQFVADWYEENKNDFEYSLYRLCIDFYGRKLHEDLHEWFKFDKNKPIETLILMHKFGYEVEKEKLYTVEIPNPNSIGGKLVLFKQQSTGRLILDMLNPNINKPKYIHLTEPEIKKDFEWAWQFAKKVKEND